MLFIIFSSIASIWLHGKVASSGTVGKHGCIHSMLVC
jgi:hypothetical protein